MYEYSLPSSTRAYRMQRVREMNERMEHKEHVFEVALSVFAFFAIALYFS